MLINTKETGRQILSAAIHPWRVSQNACYSVQKPCFTFSLCHFQKWFHNAQLIVQCRWTHLSAWGSCSDLLAAPPWGPISLIIDVERLDIFIFWSNEGNGVNLVAPSYKISSMINARRRQAGEQCLRMTFNKWSLKELLPGNKLYVNAIFFGGFNDYSFEKILK